MNRKNMNRANMNRKNMNMNNMNRENMNRATPIYGKYILDTRLHTMPIIKVSEDNEHGAAALYSQQQAKKFGSY